MQVESGKAEIEIGHREDSCFKTPVDNYLIQDMSGLENSGSVKIECDGTVEHVVETENGTPGVVKSDGLRDPNATNSTKAELVHVEPAEIDCDVQHGEVISSGGVDEKSDIGILDVRISENLERLGCCIEEGLEKVTLTGDGRGMVADGSCMKEMGSGNVSISGSESDSESETSSSCSTSSSSSSESDDEEEEMVKEDDSCKSKKENIEQIVEIEEGQIVDAADKMVSWTDNEDEAEEEEEEEDDSIDEILKDFELDEDDEESDLPKGPIRSKNELQALPPVPPVNVSLQPSHQISPVGAVSSVLGTQVIVEGSEKHNPLSEGSILWIVESRVPLGLVDEIFGPVKAPYYIIRYNSESEVPSGIVSGTVVGFVSEFVGHVLNDKSLYQKGYDASGDNDEEVYEEAEFSDDEKEAEFKRMLKMSKRENNNEGQGPGNKKKNRKNVQRKERTWTKNQPSSQSPTVQPSQPNKMQQHMRTPSPSFNQGDQMGASPAGTIFNGGSQTMYHGNQPGSSQMGPMFSGGPAFSQVPQPFMFNGNLANSMPSQQPNMAMPSGFQMNGMPWLQQNHPQALQMPPTGPVPWQQQQFASQFPFGNAGPSLQPFDLSQLVSGSNGFPLRPTNFNTGAVNSPWPNLMSPNHPGQAPFVAGFQNPGVQLPMFSGFAPNGQQLAGQSSDTPPAANHPENDQSSSQFSQGFSSGRGRGRKPFHRRGGHFGGGRGRQQN